MATSLDGLTSLCHQVAGHPGGVKTLEDGQWVVKDCLPRELAFYSEITAATHQAELLQRLAKLVPECRGSWQDYSGEEAAAADSASPPRIVLENLTYGYSQPNVCDVKLGTQLWDQESSDEKRKRMDLVSQSTTSGSHGIRLTGWQVYNNLTHTYHAVPKTFGKALKGDDQLQLGVRMLLACPHPQDALYANAILPNAAHDPLPSLPKERVVQLLQHHLLPAMHQLVDIFSHLHVRMRGASVLLVYEGKLDAPPTADLRLIDFGHATLVPGQGIDEGVLLGLQTLTALLERQLQQLLE